MEEHVVTVLLNRLLGAGLHTGSSPCLPLNKNQDLMKSFVCRFSRRLQHQLHRFPLQRAGREQTRLACSGCRKRSSPQHFGISRPECFCFCFPSQKKKKITLAFSSLQSKSFPFPLTVCQVHFCSYLEAIASDKTLRAYFRGF